MRIAIVEITTHGHYTLVESIAKIYASHVSNEVVIFIPEQGKQALKGLENERIKIVAVNEDAETFFSTIHGFDKVFIPTLEAYSRVPYQIMKVFLKNKFDCPIYYCIHNVDFWFQQSFFDKIRNIFYQLSKFSEFIYRLKIYFKYVSINPNIVQKVIQSGGKLVALTDSVGNELLKYVGNENIAIVPFSIYDGRIIDKSSQNPRLRVCIPGLLDTTRRDYDSVFKIMSDYQDFFKSNITWDFLGGNLKNEVSLRLIDKIKLYQKQGHDIRFYEDSFLSMEDYDSNLGCADIVLGNMYLRQGANSVYGKSKETGIIFTMIKAAKAGILPAEYTSVGVLKSSIWTFNNYQEVANILMKLIENPSELAKMKQNAHNNSEQFRPLSIYNRLEETENGHNQTPKY